MTGMGQLRPRPLAEAAAGVRRKRSSAQLGYNLPIEEYQTRERRWKRCLPHHIFSEHMGAEMGMTADPAYQLKTLRIAVVSMREHQFTYLRTKSWDALARAKDAEARVEKMSADMMHTGPD